MDRAELQGWWLNLPTAQSRAETLTGNLRALHLGHYQRFEGQTGDAQEAAARSLSLGEAGAWSSWLQMMEQAGTSQAGIVHLLEDDTEITPGLQRLLAWEGLNPLLEHGAVVCTDGYVSPGQARHLISQPSWGESWHCITEGLAVPCIGSLLARPRTWKQLHALLQAQWHNRAPLAPIDVMLGQLPREQVPVITMAPFVTLPRLEQARISQIRSAGDLHRERSREALTLLRRLLGWPQQPCMLWQGEWDLFWRSQPEALQQQAVLDALDGLVQRGELHPY